MKIAILTQPLHTNYGGILQAYALQTFLQRRGHKVVVINREYYWDGGNKLTIQNLFLRIGSFIKSLIRIYVLRYDGYVLKNPFSPYYHAERSTIDPLPFVKKQICQSPEIRTTEQLEKYFKKHKFDAYIVGSDQVWRPCYSPCITDFFLNAVPLNSKSIKISYAASFGTDVWEFSDEETEICSSLAQKFDAISVREQSGVQLCKKYLGVDAVHLLDPTMLLTVDDYLHLIEDTKVYQSDGSMFCYILDENPEIEHIISSLEQENFTSYRAVLNQSKYNISVEQWLKSFYDAELVITDSFHACVFSLLFKKPFIVWANRERGFARLKSLLEIFGMQNRLIFSIADFIDRKHTLLNNKDFENLELIFQERVKDSYDFFRSVGVI